MGKKGSSLHLKREVAPKFWPIERKKFQWVVKPASGPHAIHNSIPLIILLRDILGYAKTRKEAKKIVTQGNIIVDGVIRRNERYPVGLMDVVSIPKIKQNYRVLPSKKGLILNEIEDEEKNFKLCRIENKKILKKGQIQINLHDGRNIVLTNSNDKGMKLSSIKNFDTLKINIPNQEIQTHLSLEVGNNVLFFNGKNIGKSGVIQDIREEKGRKRKFNLVTIKDLTGQVFQSILDYTFVIGEKEPLIALVPIEKEN